MRINCLTTVEQAWANAQPWREMTANTPLLSPEWLLTWWSHIGNKQELMILQCEDENGKTVGFCPLSSVSVYGHQRLESLGAGHVCTDYTRIIANEPNHPAVSDAIAKYLTAHFSERPKFRSSELVFEGVALGRPEHIELEKTLEQNGFHICQYPLQNSYQLPLPKTWQEYVNQLSASAKRKVRKLTSRIDSGSCSFHQCSDPAGVMERMDDLHRLHQNRRQVLGQAGSYSAPNFQDFIRDAVARLAAVGRVRMEWCEFDNNIVAIHLLLLGDDTTYMYQSGINPDFMEIEPGHLLTVSAIRSAIENGLRFYDFLRGEEAYKSFWGGQPVPLVTLRCRPPRAMSRLVGFTHDRYWDLKRTTKNMLGFAKTIRLPSPQK